ncbi:hypothetical protein AAMO2058_000051800 [Amorphochlora amoebiformis]
MVPASLSLSRVTGQLPCIRRIGGLHEACRSTSMQTFSGKRRELFEKSETRPPARRRLAFLTLVALLGPSALPKRSDGRTWNPEYAFQEGIEQPEEGWEAPEITQSSSERAIAISDRLTRLGTVMYGAYWCPHCNQQKEMFGKEAMKKIKYVECAGDGMNTSNKESICKDLAGYPTWEIDGAQFPGERSLDEFEAILDLIEGTRPPEASVGWTRRYLEEMARSKPPPSPDLEAQPQVET